MGAIDEPTEHCLNYAELQNKTNKTNKTNKLEKNSSIMVKLML